MSASKKKEDERPSCFKRIDKIKAAKEDIDELIEVSCSFFIRGGHPDCVACLQNEERVLECRDYLIGRFASRPMDFWSEDFDKFIPLKRPVKTPTKEVSGIGVNCDVCYMSDKCPMFKTGYECGIEWDDDKPESPEAFYEFLMNVQYERVKRASVFEKVDGGVPDAGLSGEMDRLSVFVDGKVNLTRERMSINIDASGPSNPQGGGILAKLFGGGARVEDEFPEEPIIRKD